MAVFGIIKNNPIVSWLWTRIRLCRILSSHRKVSRICDAEIEKYLVGELVKYQYQPKKDLGTERIIWQYWESNGKEIPELVRICMESVENHSEGYKLVRLSDSNLHDYIDLPLFLEELHIDKTHYTDIVRLALLSAYGGVWLDATVFLSGELPERFLDYPFLMYQRDPNEEHKSYWENTWAYYFGWHPDFKVTVLSSILFGKRGNQATQKICDLLINHWEKNKELPDYFYLQILIHQMLEHGVIENIPLCNDTLPHMLQQEINVGYPFLRAEEIVRTQTIHKLTYKFDGATERLKSIADRL